MSNLVDSRGKDLLAEFQSMTYSFGDELDFLERVAFTRMHYLMDRIDPKYPTSAGVVNRRLREPMELLEEIKKLRNSETPEQESHETLDRLKAKFFGVL